MSVGEFATRTPEVTSGAVLDGLAHAAMEGAQQAEPPAVEGHSPDAAAQAETPTRPWPQRDHNAELREAEDAERGRNTNDVRFYTYF